MNKKTRDLVKSKYNNKCAYCGCELQKIWHIDHLLPVVRSPLTGVKTYPERDKIENLMPSCPSCNISKHSGSIEDFRRLIKGFMKHLNEISVQYKIAKRYGLVEETGKDVVFYFETQYSQTYQNETKPKN